MQLNMMYRVINTSHRLSEDESDNKTVSDLFIFHIPFLFYKNARSFQGLLVGSYYCMSELKKVNNTKQKSQILLPSGWSRKKKRPAENKPQFILLKAA